MHYFLLLEKGWNAKNNSGQLFKKISQPNYEFVIFQDSRLQ